MLEKAPTLRADEVVIDLEDSVPSHEKNGTTRRRVADALLSLDWRGKTVAVRVNAVNTPWFADDLRQLIAFAGETIHCVVLPKVETVDDVCRATSLLDDLGVSTAIEAQIESARGLVDVERIATASERLEALIFGPGDYAASLGVAQAAIGLIDPAYPGDQWHYPRSRIAAAAHAFGLDAIDGPYAILHDASGLRESARRARLLGFGGKWAIHPEQVDVCNEEFAPSQDQIEHARRVLQTLEDAAQRGHGATALDGVMIDEASRKLADAVLARAIAVDCCRGQSSES